jgi:RimJ/RimL family protein N-acetyltransferase
MNLLSTERLVLAPLTRTVMERRIARESFTLPLDGVGGVSFPSSWPGEALRMFRSFLATGDDVVRDTFVAIDRASLVAVGQLGVVGAPTRDGAYEIGYGFGMSGRGYATEAAAALIEHLLSRPEVAVVTAKTAVWNLASERVLEKNGFVETGTGWDEDDGDLILWERAR